MVHDLVRTARRGHRLGSTCPLAAFPPTFPRCRAREGALLQGRNDGNC
jgi:hypothetical protein